MINTEDKNQNGNRMIAQRGSFSITGKTNTVEEKKPEIQIRLNNVGTITDKTKKDYHEQRLSQSKWAFRLSFWSSIIGFGIIIGSVFWGIYTNAAQWPGIIAGVIIEAISALFYTLLNIANEKISEFFIELTKDTNIQTAVKLSGEIKNENIKDELKVKLSLHLAGINEEKICKNTKEICKEIQERR